MDAQLWALAHTLSWIFAGISLVIFVIYIIGAISSKSSIVKTEFKKDVKELKANHIYYLPTTSLLVKAKALVIITKEVETGNIVQAKLAELAIETDVQKVPDTSYAFALQYCPSAFSNDDLKFSIDPSGLLNGINLTADDRITNVITQLMEAPKIILGGDQALESKSFKSGEETETDGLKMTTETKEYLGNFTVLTKEIRNGHATRSWKINVDGTSVAATTVDASFSIGFEGLPEKFHLQKDTEYAGIVSRPIQTITVRVNKGNESKGENAVQYNIIVPDESRIVVTPIKRASFVKKTYSLKLTDGVLTESTIAKPSEMESFVSIPIKIAKAIVSIPAQLLSFKIENIKRQTMLQTEQQNLFKAELQAQKDGIAKDADLLKVRLDAHKTALTYESELTKTKLEAEKTLLDTQKNIISAATDMINTKKDWEKAKKELEELLRKIQEEHEKKYKVGQNNNIN